MHQSSSDDDDDDGFRPIKRHSKGETSKQDSGFQDSGSESGLPRHTKQEISNHKHVANQFVSNVANQEDEESDLEIEPPAAV